MEELHFHKLDCLFHSLNSSLALLFPVCPFHFLFPLLIFYTMATDISVRGRLFSLVAFYVAFHTSFYFSRLLFLVHLRVFICFIQSAPAGLLSQEVTFVVPSGFYLFTSWSLLDDSESHLSPLPLFFCLILY